MDISFALPTLQAYQIKRGDTLWDISERFLKNPFLWPKVWALNPYIPNPHWIYPGNRIRLKQSVPIMPSGKIPEVKKPRFHPAPPLHSHQTMEQKPVKKPVSPSPPLFSYEDIHSSGFIAESRLSEIGRVITNEDHTLLNSEQKILCFYTKHPEMIHPGDRFTTFTYVKIVKSPYHTFKKLGYLIQVGGDIEVTHIEGHICFAKILHSYREIGENDPISRFEQWPTKFVITPFKGPLKACIVTMKEGLMMGAEGSVVYIDRGSTDGLRQGDQLSIYKSCPPSPNPYHTTWKTRMDLTDRRVGSLVILSTQPHTATALIIASSREIEVGDIVRP